MDKKLLKERAKKLQEVNRVISKLDPAIRADAFSLLRDYVTEHTEVSGSSVRQEKHKAERGVADTSDAEAFFSKHQDAKPAENGVLAAAFLYGQYGAAPFSLSDIRQLAADVGFTIPGRIDMTFLQAKRKGKRLFRRAGKVHFKPTVYGETAFKSEYQVKKGKKNRPGNNQS